MNFSNSDILGESYNVGTGQWQRNIYIKQRQNKLICLCLRLQKCKSLFIVSNELSLNYFRDSFKFFSIFLC